MCVCVCVGGVCGVSGQRERFHTHEDDGHLKALLARLIDNAARITVVVKILVCYADTITNEHLQKHMMAGYFLFYIFFYLMQMLGPTTPFSRATSLARWIVVPSAMGSVKGTPTSITCRARARLRMRPERHWCSNHARRDTQRLVGKNSHRRLPPPEQGAEEWCHPSPGNPL